MEKKVKRVINSNIVLNIARRFQISVGLAYVVYSRFLSKHDEIPDDKDSAKALFLFELEEYQNEERFNKIEQYLEFYGISGFYHITHIDNLEGILESGLKPKNLLPQLSYKDISNQEIQQVRSVKKNPLFNNRSLHDFVPLFIKPNPPMHYALKTIQDELLYLHIKTLVCGINHVIFSDGNARSNKTKFFNNWEYLSKLDWNVLNNKYWVNTNEEIHKENKRIRSAEVLVPQVLSPIFIESIGVLNKEKINKVKKVELNSNHKINVFYDSNLRFE